MSRLEIAVLVLALGAATACGGSFASMTGTRTTASGGPQAPQQPTGMIKGSILGPDVEGNLVPVPGVSVVVFTVPGPGAMGAVVARRTTDALGEFAVDSLPAARYGVAVNPPAPFAFQGADLFVAVAAGTAASADFTLQRKF